MIQEPPDAIGAGARRPSRPSVSLSAVQLPSLCSSARALSGRIRALGLARRSVRARRRRRHAGFEPALASFRVTARLLLVRASPWKPSPNTRLKSAEHRQEKGLMWCMNQLGGEHAPAATGAPRSAVSSLARGPSVITAAGPRHRAGLPRRSCHQGFALMARKRRLHRFLAHP